MWGKGGGRVDDRTRTADVILQLRGEAAFITHILAICHIQL